MRMLSWDSPRGAVPKSSEMHNLVAVSDGHGGLPSPSSVNGSSSGASSSNAQNPISTGSKRANLKKADTFVILNQRRNISGRYHRNMVMLFVSALIGLALMVIENEILIQQNGSGNVLTHCLKIAITLSTLVAEYALYMYYKAKFDDVIFHRGLIVDTFILPHQFILQYLVEAFIILIHPLPGLDSTITFNGITGERVSYHWDAILGIIMLFRIYLLYRMMKYLTGYYSKKVELIGKLNHVNITSSFSMKAFLHSQPFLFLLTSLLINIFVFGYAVRLCECNIPESDNRYYAETIWYMYVTIATIGYGDISVKTYCARTVVILASAWGVVTTALLISIVDQSLKLSFPQMRVVNLLADDIWGQKMRQTAAVALQRIWRLRRAKEKTMKMRLGAITALYKWRKIRRHYQYFIDRSEIALQKDPLMDAIRSDLRFITDNTIELHSKLLKIENLMKATVAPVAIPQTSIPIESTTLLSPNPETLHSSAHATAEG